MMMDYGMGWGFGWMGMILFWLVPILLVLVAFKYFSGRHGLTLLTKSSRMMCIAMFKQSGWRRFYKTVLPIDRWGPHRCLAAKRAPALGTIMTRPWLYYIAGKVCSGRNQSRGVHAETR